MHFATIKNTRKIIQFLKKLPQLRKFGYQSRKIFRAQFFEDCFAELPTIPD